MKQPYRIAIIDDQTLIRNSLIIVLNRQDDIEIAFEAANGHEAIDLVEMTQPDLILMDMRMPIMDGIEATKSILKKFPNIKVVALTTFEEDELIAGCLEAGAVGYLLKDLTAEDLLKAIGLIRKGESILPSSYLRKLIVKPGKSLIEKEENAPESFSSHRTDIDLTNREIEVLRFLLEGLSNKEIAKKLYVSETTVKNHLSSMFAKMDVRDRTQAVLFAVQNKILYK